MNIKDISICPDKNCECCKLTRKLMETIEPSGADTATAVVSLCHALARTIYHEAKGSHAKYFETAEFSARTIVRALGRLEAADKQPN